MIRYFYLLSLLIYINFIFCYEYSSYNDSNDRSISRLKNGYRHRKEALQRRNQRKRFNYDAYNNDPVAEIDVAGFINSVEHDSLSGDDTFEQSGNKMRSEKSYNSYDGLTNDIINVNEDYVNADAGNLKDTSYYHKFDTDMKGKKISDKLTSGIDKVSDDSLDANMFGYRNKHHQEKKCILKNFKLPFFSHDKSVTSKGKKDKKRKLDGFNDIKEQNIMTKGDNGNILKKSNGPSNTIYKGDKVKKRSYIERLCPACRRKFILLKSPKSQPHRIYNSRNMCNKRKTKSNGIITKNSEIDVNKYNGDAINHLGSGNNLEIIWSNRRKKREEDGRHIERQKELEYLEKRVESVTINNPSDKN